MRPSVLCAVLGLTAGEVAISPMSCYARADGDYTDVSITSGSISVGQLHATCKDGWTIVKEASVDKISDLFNSWASHDTGIFGPSSASVSAGFTDPDGTLWTQADSRPGPMQTSFAGWSKLSGTHDFSTSDDCSTITGTSGDAYYASGSYMYNPNRGSNCVYYNRNCDMDTSTLQCHNCADNYNSNPGGNGACTHRVGGATDRYPMHTNNCHHWWNRFPSIPTKNNKFCIALKELAPPSDIPSDSTPAPTPMVERTTDKCALKTEVSGMLTSTCNIEVISHDKKYDVAQELMNLQAFATMPGENLINHHDSSADVANRWGSGTGDFSTNLFYRHGVAHATTPPTNSAAEFNLYSVHNNYHWGGVHIEFEVWEMYFSPGVKRYEYTNDGGTYMNGGVLDEGVHSKRGGRCTLQLQYGGEVSGSSANGGLHHSTIVLSVPVYTTCFVRMKQTLSSMSWVADSAAQPKVGGRSVQYLQKFASKDAHVTHYSKGDYGQQICKTDC